MEKGRLLGNHYAGIPGNTIHSARSGITAPGKTTRWLGGVEINRRKRPAIGRAMQHIYIGCVLIKSALFVSCLQFNHLLIFRSGIWRNAWRRGCGLPTPRHNTRSWEHTWIKTYEPTLIITGVHRPTQSELLLITHT